jgi:hypothetical protein
MIGRAKRFLQTCSCCRCRGFLRLSNGKDRIYMLAPFFWNESANASAFVFSITRA